MSTSNETLYEGSIESVRGFKGKIPYIFEYTDHYSTFDWKKKSDSLPGKGKAQALMAYLFFDFLGQAKNWKNWKTEEVGEMLDRFRSYGVNHHCLHYSQPDQESNRDTYHELLVRGVNVLLPRVKNSLWDYSAYLKKPVNTLVPLEIIFCFGAPEGSSLLKRSQNPKYLETLHLSEPIFEGCEFSSPLIEFSTKLETKDKICTYKEAQKIAGMSNHEMIALKETSKLIAMRLKDFLEGAEIKLWGGKLEFAFVPPVFEKENREFMLVDSLGLDEMQLSYQGLSLTSQYLGKNQKKIMEEMYQSLAQHLAYHYWKVDFFEEAPSLSKIIKKLNSVKII
jgi:phosphoribosylaminoimidazole-succinocarboxamide synthase